MRASLCRPAEVIGTQPWPGILEHCTEIGNGDQRFTRHIAPASPMFCLDELIE